MSNIKNIRKELTTLGQEDLSDEIGKINKVKGELDIKSSEELMEKFDAFLEDKYGDAEIAEMKFNTSTILKKIDRAMYLEELDEYVNDMIKDEGISEEDQEILNDFANEIDI